MQMHTTLLFALVAVSVLPACDPQVVDEQVQLREDSPVVEPGCSYPEPLNYNDDFQNAPRHCAMKLALCVDSFVIGCDDDPIGCRNEIGHCFQHLDVCWKSTGAF